MVGRSLRWLKVRSRFLGLGAVGCALLGLLPRMSTAETAKDGGAEAGVDAAPLREWEKPFVVHFGDSFVHAGLQQSFRPRLRAMGMRYVTEGRTSAWLSTWAGPGVDRLYWSYRPALFLVTLGANDLSFKPAEKRAYLVRDIVQKMRGTPCVWIGVPIWEGAPRDFVEMIRRESAPCRYFDSTAITTRITRQEDNRHPDEAGGRLWAEAVWEWLMKQRDPERGVWALKPAPVEEHAPRPDPDPWGKVSASPPSSASP